MSEQPVAVATGGDAPSVEEEAAGQASFAAGAAYTHEVNAADFADEAQQAADTAVAAVAVAETAGEAAAVATEAAEEASGARDDITAAISALAASQAALADELRAGREAAASVTPEPVTPEPPEPDRAPKRKEHWINRKVGGKR